VGYWPFNGNANDESGNGNNGTVNGGALLVTDRYGISGKAYNFDGINDYININNSPSLANVPDLTISVWVKLTINNGNLNSGIVTKWYYSNSTVCNNSNFDSYTLVIYNNNYSGSTNRNTIAGNQVNSNLIYNDDLWHHLIFTHNQLTGGKFFIDGSLVSTLNTNGSICPSTNDLLFGADNYQGNIYRFLKGNLDDIGIWNRALNQQEITALYNGCSIPTATITPQSTTTFCQNGSVVLNASTGSGYTYEWYKDGNLINGSTTSFYTANQSGSYTVKVINGSCNATSSATTVTVNPNPNVSLSLANFIHIKESPVTLAGSPLGGTYSGVGVVGSTFSSTNAGLGKKTITYNYTTGAGCSGSATAITTVYDTTACSTFDTLFINIAVAGLTAPNNLGTLKIWPNPANDRITIDNGNYGILSGYSVKIETVLGQEVFKSAINQQQFSVDLTTWNGKGIYLVHILDVQSNIIETKKIILQ
jgi:hypothetical protein